MHLFVAPHNGVGGAGFDAQRAANAPSFINHRHGSWRFNAEAGVEGQGRAMRHRSKAGNAFGAARWALVDGRFGPGDGQGVGRAVRITAARALCLRQHGVDAPCQVELRGRGARTVCHQALTLGLGASTQAVFTLEVLAVAVVLLAVLTGVFAETLATAFFTTGLTWA